MQNTDPRRASRSEIFRPAKKKTQNPKQLEADVNHRLLNFIFSELVCVSEQLNVLLGNSAYFAAGVRSSHQLVLLCHSFLRLHVSDKHFENLGAPCLLVI